MEEYSCVYGIICLMSDDSVLLYAIHDDANFTIPAKVAGKAMRQWRWI